MPGGFRRKRAREERRVRVDGNGLRQAVVGSTGLADDALAHLLVELDADAEQLERQRRIGWALLPASRTDLREIGRVHGDVAAGIGDVVVLTTSAVPIEALASALTRDEPSSTRTQLHVVDGPDPDRFAALVETLEWPRTLVVVASAGDTDLLTTSHFLVVRDRLLRELGAVEYRRHIVMVTPPGDAALGQIVHDEGFRSLALADVGDRAPVALGVATLLPLACVGVDVAELVSGAAAMLERRQQLEGTRPAHLLAAGVRLAGRGGLRIVSPASRSLQGLARWMEDRLAVPIAEKDAPPYRRVTLVIGVAADAAALVVPKAYQDVESVGFVGGLDLGVLSAQARAADELARWADGELTLSVTLPDVSPHAIGQLVALTEAAACLASPSAATPPPARAARFAFGLVGRSGYEADRVLAERLAGQREERWVA